MPKKVNNSGVNGGEEREKEKERTIAGGYQPNHKLIRDMNKISPPPTFFLYL